MLLLMADMMTIAHPVQAALRSVSERKVGPTVDGTHYDKHLLALRGLDVLCDRCEVAAFEDRGRTVIKHQELVVVHLLDVGASV